MKFKSGVRITIAGALYVTVCKYIIYKKYNKKYDKEFYKNILIT